MTSRKGLHSTGAKVSRPPDSEGVEDKRVTTRRRPAEVRQELLEAAERVVIRKGLATTAQDIACEAGIHRTVLQRHFPDTSELVRESALRPFRDFLAVLQARVERGQVVTTQPTWELTRELLAELFANFVKHRAFISRVLADPSVLGTSNWKVLHQTLDELIDSLSVLSESQNTIRGLDIKLMPIKTRLTVALIAGLATHRDWLLPRGERAISAGQLIDDMCDFVLYGLRLPSDDVRELDRLPPPNEV